jgi:hypothetical protein
MPMDRSGLPLSKTVIALTLLKKKADPGDQFEVTV